MKEYDENYCIRKFTSDFIDNGFPYVSMIDGGYLVLINILNSF